MQTLFHIKISKNSFISFLVLSLLVLFIQSCTTESTPTYQLTTSSFPAEGGSVSPTMGNYDEGTEVQVQATSNENWVFDGWEGAQTGSQNPVTITMDSDKEISARFVKKEYPLTINYQGEGTVTETVVQTKSTDYEYGTLVELEAFSGTGHNFGSWTGDLESIENPVQVMIDGPKKITAVFEPMEFNVQVSADGPGTASVEPDKDVYVYNETATFTAEPHENIQFVGWFNETGSFEMLDAVFEYQITSDLDITAFFRTVKDAFVVESVSISSTDGVVDQVIFNIINYLLDDVILIGADVFNDEGKKVGTLRFDTPPTLPRRSGYEARVRFGDDLNPDEETIDKWVFKWLFDFDGESYEKSQEVGEPTSNAKEKQILLKSIEIENSFSLDIH